MRINNIMLQPCLPASNKRESQHKKDRVGMEDRLEIPQSLLRVHTSHREPTDREFRNAVRMLSNLEFNPPADPNKVVESLAIIKSKLDATPIDSPSHNHMMRLLAKLCPEKKGKVDDVDIHMALQSLQANAIKYNTTFQYSNTSLAQSFVASAVTNLNKNAPQKT